jgi:hypothetical protein
MYKNFRTVDDSSKIENPEFDPLEVESPKTKTNSFPLSIFDLPQAVIRSDDEHGAWCMVGVVVGVVLVVHNEQIYRASSKSTDLVLW